MIKAKTRHVFPPDHELIDYMPRFFYDDSGRLHVLIIDLSEDKAVVVRAVW